MEDKRQIYKEAYKKIDELEKEIDSLKKEKERLEVNTTDELEKLRGRFFLIDGNMKYLLSDLCGRIDVFEIAKNEEEEKYDFTHNPFNNPKGGSKALENENIDEIVAEQFDFVCNGVEMASGAVRNHDPEVMKKAFAVVGLGEDVIEEKFGALYTAFQYGAPPHAGMAPGIDRMLMMLLDEDSIRETIAFPLNANGADSLMQAPSDISELQLREAHIKIREKN